MNITEKSKIYRVIKEAEREGSKVILEFTFYHCEGEWNEELSFKLDRLFKRVLNDYIFIRTLQSDHFLRELSIDDAESNGSSYYNKTYAFNFEICEIRELKKGKLMQMVEIGDIRMSLDYFLFSVDLLTKRYEEYIKQI